LPVVWFPKINNKLVRLNKCASHEENRRSTSQKRNTSGKLLRFIWLYRGEHGIEYHTVSNWRKQRYYTCCIIMRVYRFADKERVYLQCVARIRREVARRDK